ncbi:mechanosensitive ion channel [Shewanella cyperi]|uniref:Mechanosensing system component YbdG n=1 Tax=Shewanella cyperi TaxID=2814292 RepID=A0A974XKG6_9GAMM|nr:mechanosensitive ion channel domain-containing protein [Shewanella cyperi]QSX30070.1 mechanosensitive ion channel [Shewanella cyperi]
MNSEIQVQLAAWLSELGMDADMSATASVFGMMLLTLLVALLAYVLVRRGVVRAMNLVIKRSRVTWDDVFMRHRVLEKLSLLVPVLVLDTAAPVIFAGQPLLLSLTGRLLEVTMVVLLVRGAYSGLDAVNEVADLRDISRRLPIKSVVQLIKLFLFFIALIVAISVLADQSPVYFLSGLGVATGLVMLVFKDTILGFVAGIQLAANRMVSKGDWIQMDKYGADGSVEEVSLTTVKVRNWDNTITMIPAYALVSDAFRNWRGMSESGGRRIKRALHLDISSIRFLTEADRLRLGRINHLKEYLSGKEQELAEANASVADADMPVNGRRLTNVGTLRAYLTEYLRRHEKIHKDMTLMVRQLAPTTEGLPLELYIFTNDTRWVYYEGIQADIFDHILAILPEFDLRAFQNPTGNDIRSLKAVS